MHINDFPRPTSTLTRPLCILMIFLDLPRHLLDSNPANSQHTILLWQEEGPRFQAMCFMFMMLC